MNQYDAPQRGSQVRERAAFSYKASTSEPDLIEQINKLRVMKKSPYWNRSFADVAGMILLEYVPKEIERFAQGKEKRGIAGKKKASLEVNHNGRG